mmetsp:Transcript_6239/g.10334  ORF Transcript_6239/g.10334 Transcript_6239/m.10334 type:complete len:435 (-) Transcript_6239:203-1507(-)
MVIAGNVSWKIGEDRHTATCLMCFKCKTIAEIVMCQTSKQIEIAQQVFLTPSLVVRRSRSHMLAPNIPQFKIPRNKREENEEIEEGKPSISRGPKAISASSKVLNNSKKRSWKDMQSCYHSSSSSQEHHNSHHNTSSSSQLLSIPGMISHLDSVSGSDLGRTPELVEALMAAAAAIRSACEVEEQQNRTREVDLGGPSSDSLSSDSCSSSVKKQEDIKKRVALTHKELPVPKLAIRNPKLDLESPDPRNKPLFRPPAYAHNEQERLACLRNFNLDRSPEEVFDNIVGLAINLCKTSFGALNLVGKEKLFFKAAIGTGKVRESPRDISFCSHTILYPDTIFVVNDATEDPRFADCPMVTRNNVRFYAGVPIQVDDEKGNKCCVGTICVWDDSPKSLDKFQCAAMSYLAGLAQCALLMKRKSYKNLEECGFKDANA